MNSFCDLWTKRANETETMIKTKQMNQYSPSEAYLYIFETPMFYQ